MRIKRVNTAVSARITYFNIILKYLDDEIRDGLQLFKSFITLNHFTIS